MATHDSSQALDPSDYVAQHLQNFSTPGPASVTSGTHPAFFVWSSYILAIAVVLFAVLAGFAALKDGGAPFRLGRSMSFGRRLYVWWSCAWRQYLAGILFLVISMFAFHFLIPRAVVPLMTFSFDVLTPDFARNSRAWSLAIAAMPAIVLFLIYMLASLPLAGYMVRGGLVAHAIRGSGRFGFRQAALLGVTTYAWAVPASLAMAGLAIALPHHAENLLRAVFIAAWGMYIVLPRQVRRIERLGSTLH